MKILSLKSCPGLSSKMTKPRKKSIDSTGKTVRQLFKRALGVFYWGAGVPWCTCGGQKITLKRQCSPIVFLGAPATELGFATHSCSQSCLSPERPLESNHVALISEMPHVYVLCFFHMNYWWAKFTVSNLQLSYTFLKYPYSDFYSSKFMSSLPYFLLNISITRFRGNPGSLPVVTKVVYIGISGPPISHKFRYSHQYKEHDTEEVKHCPYSYWDQSKMEGQIWYPKSVLVPKFLTHSFSSHFYGSNFTFFISITNYL